MRLVACLVSIICVLGISYSFAERAVILAGQNTRTDFIAHMSIKNDVVQL